MTRAAEIQRQMAEMMKTSQDLQPAEVLSLEKDSRTITVRDIHGIEIDQVRLKSVIDGEDSVVLWPKEGSVVLIAPIGDESAAYYKVAGVGEVESVEGVIEKTSFELDKDGYKIERDGENLKTILNDWITEVSKIVIVQGTTINVAAMAKINERINKVLK